MTEKSLFISKDLSEIKELETFCKKNGWQLNAHSFLSFQAVPFELPPSFDVLFFGSKRAIIYFLERYSIPKSIQIACVGKATEKELESKGYKASFSGKNAGAINELKVELKEWLGNRIVLFAQAHDSNRSFSQDLSPAQCHERIVYRTAIKGKKVEPSDFYVFTSPSNLKGFLEKNSIPQNGKIIAWGETTEKELIKNNLTCEYVLKTAGINELISFLRQR